MAASPTHGSYTKNVWPIAASCRTPTRRARLRTSPIGRRGRPLAVDEHVLTPLERHGNLGANRQVPVVTALRARLEPESLRRVIHTRLIRLRAHHTHLVIHHARADPVEGSGYGVPFAAPVADSLLCAAAQELPRIRLDTLGGNSSRANAPKTPQSI